MRTVLLTGTRAPATLDLARRLWREGVRVIGADSMRFPLGRFSAAYAAHDRVPPPRPQRDAFIAAIEGLAQREAVDLIWPTCEEVFHLATAHERLGRVAGLFFPEIGILELLHHKLRFAQWTQTLGVRAVAPRSWDGKDAPRGEKLIWKPVYSRFAARTRMTPPSQVAGWMAQRFVEGKEFCAWALCVGGEVRVLTQYRCPVRSGRGAGCAFEPVWSDTALEFSQKVAKELNYTGALAFDFIESDQGMYVLECNPRMTSGLHVLPPEISLRSAVEGATLERPAQRAAQLLLPVLASAPWFAGRSPDVIACKDDPVPAWTQGLALLEFLGRSLRHRIPLLGATTHDIEFNGI